MHTSNAVPMVRKDGVMVAKGQGSLFSSIYGRWNFFFWLRHLTSIAELTGRAFISIEAIFVILLCSNVRELLYVVGVV